MGGSRGRCLGDRSLRRALPALLMERSFEGSRLFITQDTYPEAASAFLEMALAITPSGARQARSCVSLYRGVLFLLSTPPRAW